MFGGGFIVFRFLGNCVAGVWCCRCVTAAGGGGGRDGVGCVVRCFDVWVLFCPAPVSVLFGDLGIWGLGGRCFVVGVR